MRIKNILGWISLHAGMAAVFFGGSALDSEKIGIPMAICLVGTALLMIGTRMVKDS